MVTRDPTINSGRDNTGLIVALTALALVLRVVGINQDLWLDEIGSVVDLFRLQPFEAAGTFTSANHHLLNSFLGSISIRIFDESPWSARLPALLFGTATIPAFFALAVTVAKRREALFATLFLTLSYHHVWFSQNARGYTAMIFFTVLSTLFLIRWLGATPEQARRPWLGFIVCGALGTLSLLNYVFVLAAQFLAALYAIRGTRCWSRFRRLISSGVLVVALALLGYAAALPEMIAYFSSGGTEMGWVNPLEFIQVLVRGLGGALPALALGGALVALGWVCYFKEQPLVALMLVLPVVFNVAALGFFEFGAYPRSFLYLLPFGILVLMRGAIVVGEQVRVWFPEWGAKWPLESMIPTGILLGAILLLTYNYGNPKQNYTGSLAYAREQAAPNDVIASVGYLASGYREYYGRDLAFPESVEELRALHGPERRVWLLYSFTRDMRRHLPDIQDYIEDNLRIERVFPGTLGDGDVYLVVSPAQGDLR